MINWFKNPYAKMLPTFFAVYSGYHRTPPFTNK